MIATTSNINSGKKDTFNSSQIVSRLKEELEWLKKRYDATDADLMEALGHPPLGETIPLSVFSQGLGILEALVLHLLEQGKHPSEIAAFLNRSYSTITNTARKARQKPQKQPSENVPRLSIPVGIFRGRLTAPLQSLVAHLRDHERMRFVDIARALDRDPRNINATYKEVMRK
ncbi:hypothetical protein GOV07_02815 [Candidatus Woesearchaeota archaeon]|nr:hypothetical protein [Candidatus Woesearchaeota archaeon]